ncbi:unnamed protein product [Rotaria sp. Silwood1]|nr:unnamed protein product [Rotaria sp. Silwood1]CAF1485187.1 unnamed protein product [Rotaria sp. Silwood1]
MDYKSSVQNNEKKLSISTHDNENKENITLIWFDPNIESYEEIEKIKNQLRLINDYVIVCTDFEQCIRYIESIHREKIFLIISNLITLEILPQINSFIQIDSIFIFSIKKDQDKNLLNEYRKIIGIYINFDDLVQSIKEEIDFINNQIETFCIFDQYQILTKDLSKESAKFFLFQLFNYVFPHLPQNEQTKQHIIQLCKEYYHGNTKEIKLINEFEENYQTQDAIHWYLKQSFISKLINKALKIEDIDFLYQFRFFINDLSQNLHDQHEKILLSNETILNVYRGMKLNKEEFNKLKENQGKLISINGYLLTNQQKSKAYDFVNKSTKRLDIISIIFHIQCDIKNLNKNIIFGNINQSNNYFNEQDILFDLNACFQIESINEYQSIQIIKMNLSNQGQIITNNYIDLKQKYKEERSISIVFGRLFCNLGEYDKSQKFFQHLFHDSNDEDRAWIEFNIGRVLSFKREWNQARIYYDHAYERMMKHKPPRIKDSAHVLNNIACILPNQGKYDEALDYHQRALEIREKFYPSDHIDIAQSLYNIGRILDHQEKYDDAFEYYQGALKIQQKIYPSNHVNIARSLSNIGIILYRQGKCDEALDYHQRALKIREKIYPSDHIDIAYSLNNIGIILRNQGKYNEALDCYKKALNIEEKFYPSDHVDIAKSLSNIGNILSDQEKYQEALDYYQRALKIEERFYPSGHVDLAHSLNNIGICYENQNQREMALNYYQHALIIYEKYLPIDHPRRQKTEHNIRRLTKRNSFSK